MQIKRLDDIQPEIDALNALIRRPDVDDRTRERIEQEIRFVKAGANAEREAAYQIEFYAGDRPDVMTIHGLRIEHNGRVAAIDHIIMNRGLQLWICESKSVSELVEINEHGEWATYYRGQARGMASPIEQNKRHVAVIEEVFSKGPVTLPTSNGQRAQPRIRTFVVVSKKGRISRPPAGSRVEGLDTVIKCDQLMSRIKQANDEATAGPLLSVDEVITNDKLQNLARQLASLHVPTKNDWPLRFSLNQESPSLFGTSANASGTGAPHVEEEPANVVSIGSGRSACAMCGKSVSAAVINYCRVNTSAFGGRVLCMACQKLVAPHRVPEAGADRSN